MSNQSTQQQIEGLKLTKKTYSEVILCGKDDPYKTLMQNKLKAVAGIADSNLIAQVRIKNSSKEALRYNLKVNTILFNDEVLQEKIRNIFADKYQKIEFFKTKNPLFIDFDGSIKKMVWHHSPNHILTVSLIPETIHKGYKKALHVHGKKRREWNIYSAC